MCKGRCTQSQHTGLSHRAFPEGEAPSAAPPHTTDSPLPRLLCASRQALFLLDNSLTETNDRCVSSDRLVLSARHLPHDEPSTGRTERFPFHPLGATSCMLVLELLGSNVGPLRRNAHGSRNRQKPKTHHGKSRIRKHYGRPGQLQPSLSQRWPQHITSFKTLFRSTYRLEVVQRIRDRFFLGMTNIDTAMLLVTLYAAEKHVRRAWNPGSNVSVQH